MVLRMMEMAREAIVTTNLTIPMAPTLLERIVMTPKKSMIVRTPTTLRALETLSQLRRVL
jgi:hypothetical protein